ncbi:hypothetical protein [Lichenibacterium minor]|uniref:hypothetical protein n=1 Tax=Lichenibacterium minor TaxID=2316528 RepID=UPI001FE216A7|nr:hypothetical protein [Lichenibacterium minor]
MTPEGDDPEAEVIVSMAREAAVRAQRHGLDARRGGPVLDSAVTVLGQSRLFPQPRATSAAPDPGSMAPFRRIGKLRRRTVAAMPSM